MALDVEHGTALAVYVSNDSGTQPAAMVSLVGCRVSTTPTDAITLQLSTCLLATKKPPGWAAPSHWSSFGVT